MLLPRKIYAIQHNVTKRIYIGSSANVEKRYFAHINKLKTGTHDVEDMQKDYDEFGNDFSVYILDEIQEYDEASKEYEWMQKYNSHIRGIGYNYNDYTVRRRQSRGEFPVKPGLPSELGDRHD